MQSERHKLQLLQEGQEHLQLQMLQMLPLHALPQMPKLPRELQRMQPPQRMQPEGKLKFHSAYLSLQLQELRILQPLKGKRMQ
jgi:hypothetical protein